MLIISPKKLFAKHFSRSGALRVLLAKLYGRRLTMRKSIVAANCRIGDDVKIIRSIIGPSCCIDSHAEVRHSKLNKNITIGRYSVLWGPHIEINAGDNGVEIGSFCSIAREVLIYGYNHRTMTPSTFFINKRLFKEVAPPEVVNGNRIIIGNDVWIGARAIILPGVSVGDGSIIAAGAVVSDNVPDYAVVGGVPAKVIGYRFPRDVREALCKLKWWSLDCQTLIKNQEFFNSECTAEAISKFVR